MDEATKQRLRNFRIPDDERAGRTPEEIARIEQAMREFADPGPPVFVVRNKWEELAGPTKVEDEDE